MKSVKLEYKGYTSIISHDEKLNGRYSSELCQKDYTYLYQ